MPPPARRRSFLVDVAAGKRWNFCTFYWLFIASSTRAVGYPSPAMRVLCLPIEMKPVDQSED